MKKKKEVFLASIIILVIVILVSTGFLSFLFHGFVYVDANEEKYDIEAKVWEEDIRIDWHSDNSAVSIQNLEIGVQGVEWKGSALQFSLALKNDIDFLNGAMLSQNFPFDTRSDEYVQGKVLIQIGEEYWECKRTSIDYGKSDIKYTYLVELPEEVDLEGAVICLTDFCYTEYSRK